VCTEILPTEHIVRMTWQETRVVLFVSITAPPFRSKDAHGDDAWDSGRFVTYAVGTRTLLAHGSYTVKAFPDRAAADDPASVRAEP